MNIQLKSNQNGGTTLLFVLVVLIIITVLGLASARSTLLQERMTNTASGRNVVLQVAEAALVELEEMIVTTDPVEFRKNFHQNGCVKGYCPLTGPVAEPLWKNSFLWNNKDKIGKINKRSIPTFLDIVAYYIIEDLGYSLPICDPHHIDSTPEVHCPMVPGQRIYQITVLAQAQQGMSAMVQSQFFDPNLAVK